MLNHVGTEELETDRLLLRKFKLDDAEDMFNNWAKDPENVEFFNWSAHENIEETKRILSRWIEKYEIDAKRTYRWAIVWKKTSKVIGIIDVILLLSHIDCVELGYGVSKKYWRNGIATEVMKLIIKYFFVKVKVNRIQARYDVDNVASRRVMEKCNMKFEGILRQSDKKNTGEWCDTSIHSILKCEYFMSPLIDF